MCYHAHSSNSRDISANFWSCGAVAHEKEIGILPEREFQRNCASNRSSSVELNFSVDCMVSAVDIFFHQWTLSHFVGKYQQYMGCIVLQRGQKFTIFLFQNGTYQYCHRSYNFSINMKLSKYIWFYIGYENVCFKLKRCIMERSNI